MSELGLYGGAFDPPHRGHVALARRAKEALAIDPLVVVVVAEPAHKQVATPADARLLLAQAAFPDDDVVLDDHPRTVDMLRAHPEWQGGVFLIGADEFCELPSWKEPEELLRLTRLGVATRPGFPRERLDAVLATVDDPARVVFFDLDPVPVASSDLRGRLERGDDVGGDLPAGVVAAIRAERLYGQADGRLEGR